MTEVRGGGEITHVVTSVPPPLEAAPETRESHGVSPPSREAQEMQYESGCLSSSPPFCTHPKPSRR